MKFFLLLALSAFSAAQNVSVMVWNGVVDQKALFYGYLSIEGGLPITRGSSLWIPVGKGMFAWEMPPVSSLDAFETVSGDFNVDPNLFYDEQHDPSRLFVPRFKTSIHCSVSIPNVPTALGVLFLETSPGKYSCEIQH